MSVCVSLSLLPATFLLPSLSLCVYFIFSLALSPSVYVFHFLSCSLSLSLILFLSHSLILFLSLSHSSLQWLYSHQLFCWKLLTYNFIIYSILNLFIETTDFLSLRQLRTLKRAPRHSVQRHPE
jgi:hypothetical protein